MKFGLRYASTGRFGRGANAIELAQAAEAAGFESIWTVEHVVVPAGYDSKYPYNESGRMGTGVEDFPIPDPLIWMAYVASVTTTIRLGTGILIVPQRNPVVTAKAVATLDNMTGGGRVLLGIGVGWFREEFDAIGVPFDDRGPRTDDYIRAMQALWTQELASYDGEFVSFTDCYSRPQPAGHIPIIVGGDGKPAARRAGRLGDGFFPARADPGEVIDVMRAAAHDAGRDPDAIELTMAAPATIDELETLQARGIDRIMVPINQVAGFDSHIEDVDDLARYGREVIDRFGG